MRENKRLRLVGGESRSPEKPGLPNGRTHPYFYEDCKKEDFLMNIDMLIDGILDSYDRYGGINRTGAENFPNRENVIAVLNELQTLVFPGFKNAEDITPTNIRYITGQKVNHIITVLTKEIQKALAYTVCKNIEDDKKFRDSHCFKLAEKTTFALIEEIPEIRRLLMLDVAARSEATQRQKATRM